MNYFVDRGSIVRKIWGKSDTILFIFAGASAEFALNKAVDWLYYTGVLPSDPLGRLFSTVKYARKIVFAPRDEAEEAIRTLKTIHASLEKSRGYAIPEWAYRDVLYMLIDYSISAFELLERKLSVPEKEEVYDVFFRVGDGMGLIHLPNDYNSWMISREEHLKRDLAFSEFSRDLFKQYRVHLGSVRFKILIEAQKLVVPALVVRLLKFKRIKWIKPAIPIYKAARKIGLSHVVKQILLPSDYKEEISKLDVV